MFSRIKFGSLKVMEFFSSFQFCIIMKIAPFLVPIKTRMFKTKKNNVVSNSRAWERSACLNYGTFLYFFIIIIIVI